MSLFDVALTPDLKRAAIQGPRYPTKTFSSSTLCVASLPD